MAENVSVARQLELAKKYGGVTDKEIELIKYNGEDETQRKLSEVAFNKLVLNFSNAIIQITAHPDDVEDLSAMVPERFAVKRSDYLVFWHVRDSLDASARNEG